MTKLGFICKMCGGEADVNHGDQYSCWPEDRVLILHTGESRENLEAKGYTAEMAQFSVRWVQYRYELARLFDGFDQLGASYSAAIKSKEKEK